MALFSFLGKREIPDELPALASEEIEAGKEVRKIPEEPKINSENVYENEEVDPPKYVFKKLPTSNNPVLMHRPMPVQKEEVTPKTPPLSFFSDLQKRIHMELEDLNRLEEWYEDKFLPKDIVSDMRSYWESQKPASVINVLGRNFKERINEKIINLQNLEGEWQNIYFDLIEKEEQIKDEEQELKKILSEFIELCRRKTGFSGEPGYDESKKERRKTKKQNKN